jgi:LysM repeat protein
VPSVVERHPIISLGAVAVIAIAGTSAFFVVKDRNNTSSPPTTTTTTVVADATSTVPSTTAPSTTVPAPTSSVAVTGGFYTVQKGDTLSKIAQKLGVTIQAIEAANGITNPDKIDAGAKLKIPAGAAPTTTVKAVARTTTTRHA